MSGRRWVAGCALIVSGLAVSGPARAQSVAPDAGTEAQPGQRYQLAVMEGVLEAAVQQGARVVSREWRVVSPDVLFMTGNARARGFRLDNYGTFFDVEVPSMSQTFIYTWRLMERDAAGAAALQVLKGNIKAPADAAQRKELEQALRLLERQIGPVRTGDHTGIVASGQPRTDAALVNVPGGTPPRVPAPAPVPDIPIPQGDPNVAYTTEVKDALIDAMLDHSHALTIAAGEWLAVAAHDASERQLAGPDAYESMTVLIRIKGSDLQAFRGGQLSRAEARQRIEIREY